MGIKGKTYSELKINTIDLVVNRTTETFPGLSFMTSAEPGVRMPGR